MQLLGDHHEQRLLIQDKFSEPVVQGRKRGAQSLGNREDRSKINVRMFQSDHTTEIP